MQEGLKLAERYNASLGSSQTYPIDNHHDKESSTDVATDDIMEKDLHSGKTISSQNSLDGSEASTPVHQLERPTIDVSERNDSRRKFRKKTSLDDLLDQASKFQPQYEYSFPTSFLRKRKAPQSNESDGEEEAKQNRTNKIVKQKKTKKNVKVTSKSKASVPIEEKHTINKQPKKTGTGGMKRGPKPGRKKKSQKNTKNSIKKESTNAINNHKMYEMDSASSRFAEHKNSTNSESANNSFIDWSLPKFSPPYQIFDIDNINSYSNFQGQIYSSASLTKHHNEIGSKTPFSRNRDGSKSPIDDDQGKLIGLRSILYPDYYEEYLMDYKKVNFRYDGMAEIGKIMEYVGRIYLPEKYQKEYKETVVDIYNTAYDNKDLALSISTVEKYNQFVGSIPKAEIVNHLAATKELPRSFLHDFLQIVYTRSIHPYASKLKQYKAFSNYVYGELLPGFLTDVYSKCGLSKNHLFMDLGSGVGNCVIQASLEFGCRESFGCEIMEAASELTEIQMREYSNRCKLFGFKQSKIDYSLRKSFINNEKVESLIPECDVLLVNNFLFDGKLNYEVTKLLQKTKVGCKIISLKNIRASGYTLDTVNIESVLNRLEVKKYRLDNNSVSWTHNGGEYFISTVLDRIDESLLDPQKRDRRNTHRPAKYTR